MKNPSKDEIVGLAGSVDFDPDFLKSRYVEEREKRIVGEGNAQYVPTDGVFADFEKDPWVDPGFTRAPIIDHTEVIIAGGVSADYSPGHACMRPASRISGSSRKAAILAAPGTGTDIPVRCAISKRTFIFR
jgi:hypothetical protein